MSVKANVNIALNITEVIELDSSAAQNPTVPHGIQATTKSPYNYKGDTTIAATKAWSQTVTLTAGAATLDLTALARTGLPTVDLTGLEILSIMFRAASTNTSAITIVPGASNGYTALGLGVSLKADCEVLFHIPTGTAVDSTHKTLDLASGMATASVDIIILANTP